MVCEVVSSAVTDDTFSISSPAAAAAIAEAKAMSSYVLSEKNRKEVVAFSSTLHNKLATCLNKRYKRSGYQREKMLSKYHQLRISGEYIALWNMFTAKATGSPASPIYYQHVGNNLFKILIDSYYSMHPSGDDNVEIPPITYTEENVLRYVAGNVCRSTRNKINRNKNHPQRSKLLIAIQDLEVDRESTSSDATSAWMNEIDRGGLFHVSDDTYKLFYCMEMLIRRIFNKENVRNLNAETRDKLIDTIIHDEEMISRWDVLMAEVECNEGNMLLKMLVELYITIRGFSFAKTLVEEYKQFTKKTTQKSKALRKTVANDKEE